MNTEKVWFITGASKGLGLSLVKKLLTEGFKVAATSRNVDELKKNVVAREDVFLPLAMNITDEADVQKSIDATVAHFGSINVVVNNAGYGLIGGLEELSDTEARTNFDTNVFGSLNVIRKALPYMRKQQAGHILNISSIGGFSGGFPGFGIYCATKFAMHGFTESLAAEVKDFGINVTLVMPGYFRTNFLKEGSLIVPKTELEAYKNIRKTQAAHQHEINDNQPGDPDKAADVMIMITQQAEPPIYLFLGEDAYAVANAKIALVLKDMEAVKALATATGF